MTLEDKTKMCINHIRTMTMAYVPDCELVHRNCTGYNLSCSNYKPVGNTQPLNFGKVACELWRVE